MKRILIILAVFLTSINSNAQIDSVLRGVDVSFIPQLENLGVTYRYNGVQTDPLEIFRQNGVDYVRLRLWHTPSDGYCGLQSTITMAKRVKQKGLKLLLDFHYSDTWADPSHQTKPAAWNGLTHAVLVDSIYSYTYNTLQLLQANNALPDMVQIGNEITGGFLWPEGRIGGSYNTAAQWQQFTALLRSARNAVLQFSNPNPIPIMIHIDRGGDNAASRWFYDNLNTYHVEYDIIGLSFYPWWHGTLTKLSQNMADLQARYGKKIIVAETAYPFTLTGKDNTTNIVGTASQLHTGYPATVDGQYNFLCDIINVVKNVPNKRGAGLFYWAPEYVSAPAMGSPWENLSTFDYASNNALSSLTAFKPNDTTGAIRVTFRLNTAMHGDTLKPNSFVQIRGDIINGNDLLPSGEQVRWDESSTVILQNSSGDYWQKTVKMLPGTELQYKYWTGFSKTKPTYQRLGWEGPVTPENMSTGNYRKFVAGTKDTVLALEYYNSSGNNVAQYWRPFASKTDSVAVFFRVNMSGVTSTHRFNPAQNGPVGVRGGSVENIAVLSWDTTKVILNREQYTIMNDSYWSAVVYYPKSLSEKEQQYKFYIQNDTENGWEGSISNRSFIIPDEDTTLSWVQFNNQRIVGIDKAPLLVRDNFKIFQNYPNPFNNSTRIVFTINRLSSVRIVVYSVLGKEIATLENAEFSAGDYVTEWKGLDNSGNAAASGMYIIQVSVNGVSTTMKAVLLK